MYSEALTDHALNPRNRGHLADANAIGESQYPPCGDTLKFFLRIQDGRVEQASFTASACGPVVAVASLTTTLLTGKTVTQARALGVAELIRAAGALPPSKRHSILMVLECLHEALEHHQINEFKG